MCALADLCLGVRIEHQVTRCPSLSVVVQVTRRRLVAHTQLCIRSSVWSGLGPVRLAGGIVGPLEVHHPTAAAATKSNSHQPRRRLVPLPIIISAVITPASPLLLLASLPCPSACFGSSRPPASLLLRCRRSTALKLPAAEAATQLLSSPAAMTAAAPAAAPVAPAPLAATITAAAAPQPSSLLAAAPAMVLP